MIKKNKPEDTIVKVLQNDFTRNKNSWDCKDKTNDGDMAIHLACRFDRPNIVRFILYEKQCDPNVENDAGETPIQLTDNPLIIEYLVRSGATASSETVIKWLENEVQLSVDLIRAIVLNNPSWETTDGDAILHYICKDSCNSCCSKVEIIHCLLSIHGCNPNSKDCNGKSALQLTTDPSVMRVLIEHEGTMNFDIACKLITTKAMPEDTCVELFKLSMNNSSWESGDKTASGDTALHLACRADRCAVVLFLLFKKACNPNSKNNAGETPIQLTDNPLIIEYLVRSGATASSETVIKWLKNEVQLSVDLIRAIVLNNPSWETTDGDAILHYLCKDSYDSCCNKVEIIHCLLSIHGCNPNSKDCNGKTALQLTTDPSVMRVLIEHEGTMNFDIACKLITTKAIPENTCVELLKLSLNNSSWDSGDETISGDTTLHLASRADRCTVVHFLLFEKKCNPNVRNKAGETPIQLTMNPRVVNYLMQHGACVSSETVLRWLKCKQDETILDLLKALLQNNHNRRTTEGKSVLHLVYKSDCCDEIKIICWLISNYHTHVKDIDSLTFNSYIKILKDFTECNKVSVAECVLNMVTTTDLSDSTVVKLLQLFLKHFHWNPDCSLNEDGDTALHHACRSDRHSIAHFLLFQAGCNRYTRNKHRSIPFVFASSPGVVKMYVNTSVSLSSATVHSWLINQTRSHHKTSTEMIELLTALTGGNPYYWKTTDGDTILHLVSDRCYTDVPVETRHQIVHHLLNCFYCNPNSINSDGKTPLQLTSDETVMDKLVSHGAAMTIDVAQKVVMEKCISEDKAITLLYHFVDNHSFKLTVRSSYPDGNLVDYGDTALCLACKANRSGVAHFLLSKVRCNPNTKDNNGDAPVQLATHPKLIYDLIDHGTTMNSIVVLKLISSDNIPEDTVVRLLKKCSGWKPTEILNSTGDTALHLACKADRPSIVEFLLSHTNCGVKVENKHKNVPFLLVSSPEVVKLYAKRRVPLSSATVCTWLKRIVSCCSTEQVVELLTAFVEYSPTWKTTDGDTVLHLACKANQHAIVDFLVLKGHYNPNVINKAGLTPLQLTENPGLICNLFNHGAAITSNLVPRLTSTKEIPDDTLVKMLESCANMSKKDRNTALHNACKADRMMVVCTLLTVIKSDPNSKDKEGRTPLELTTNTEMICKLIAHGAKGGQCVIPKLIKLRNIPDSEIIQVITEINSCSAWDPKKSLNNSDDTVLHFACTANRLSLIESLIFEFGCNPRTENKEGRIPFVYISNPSVVEKHTMIDMSLSSATVYGWLIMRMHSCNDIDRIVELLMAINLKKGWMTTDGDTILHIVCNISTSHKHVKTCRALVDYLLYKAECDPNSKNGDEKTPLQLTSDVHIMRELLRCKAKLPSNNDGTDVYRVMMNTKCDSDIIKLLEEESLLSKLRFLTDNNGNTILHVACKAGRLSIVHLLLTKAHCNPNDENKEHMIPVDVTHNQKVITTLFKYGSRNPKDKSKNFFRTLSEFRGTSFLDPSVNVFVVGNSKAGKSTLVATLQKENLPFKHWLSYIEVEESEVDKNTVGIIPHDFESKHYGRVTIYDYAGHKEFHNSHASLLQHAIQSSPTVFILVVKLSDSDAEIRHNVLYWMSFLENKCSTPHLIVVGSHLDHVVNESNKKKAIIMNSLGECKQLNIIYTRFVALNCLHANGKHITTLRDELKDTCKKLKTPRGIAINTQCLWKCLFMDSASFITSNAIVKLKDVLRWVEQNQNSATIEDVKYYLPANLGALYTVCNELSNGGYILFLSNSQTPEESWIVSDKAAFLSKFNDSILASKHFKTSTTQLASSTGIVSFSKIKDIFPCDDSGTLIGIFSCLEFCWEIPDRVFSNLDDVQKDDYYFFPGLTLGEVPDKIWDYDCHYHYHCGWMLHCTDDLHFLNSRFTRNLLLRLAMKYTDKIDIDQQIPTLQRKCSMWRNGIYWGNSYGIEALVEVSKNSKTVYFLMRYRKVPDHFVTSLKLRSNVITDILEYRNTFCSEVKCSKFYMDCSTTKQYPIDIETMFKFEVKEVIKEAISPSHRDTSLVSSTGATKPLQDLVEAINEPYARLDEQVLQVLLREKISNEVISDQFLQVFIDVPSSAVELLTKIFTDSKGSQNSVDLYEKVCYWRDDCQATYQDLRQKLDEVSIFMTDSKSTLLVSWKVSHYMHVLTISHSTL